MQKCRLTTEKIPINIGDRWAYGVGNYTIIIMSRHRDEELEGQLNRKIYYYKCFQEQQKKVTIYFEDALKDSYNWNRVGKVENFNPNSIEALYGELNV